MKSGNGAGGTAIPTGIRASASRIQVQANKYPCEEQTESSRPVGAIDAATAHVAALIARAANASRQLAVEFERVLGPLDEGNTDMPSGEAIGAANQLHARLADLERIVDAWAATSQRASQL